MKRLALALGLLLAVLPAVGSATPAVSLVDLLDVDMSYTAISDNFDRHVTTRQLLDGARTGIVAYLHARGIADPNVGTMQAQANGRGAVPAIEQQIGLAIERYGDRVATRDLVYAAIRGELGALDDRYSVLFTAPELKRFSTALDGETFGGIGIELDFDADHAAWRAVNVFDGSPAARAGVHDGDLLSAVDGTPIATLPAERVVALLRGKVGTSVQLSVVRDGNALPAPLVVKRAVITQPAVDARLLPNDVGYVALRTFSLDAGPQVRQACLKLATQGARAFVFDLRGNGGGYESAAEAVASVFVQSGPVVINEARGGKRVVTMAAGNALPASPLVVLVNGDSASGSELVAAAIADHHRGRLVGTRTFGKGLVQTMYPLPDGAAIKLTTARYFTPAGRFIDGVGIDPDVVVDEPPDAQLGTLGKDPQLDRALALLAPGSVSWRNGT